MARTDTLSNFLTDVADSIRTKKGTTDKILASNFDTEIESIETGSTPNLQSKSITITENGTQTITPDEGYDGLSDVGITTNVPSSGTVPEKGFVINEWDSNGFATNITLIEYNYIPTAMFYCYRGSYNGAGYEGALSKVKNISFKNISTKLVDILEYSFYQHQIEKISLPNTIKKIGGRAFMNCGELTELELPDSLEYIGYQFGYVSGEAFNGCTKLNFEKLPSNVKLLNTGNFRDCRSLSLTYLPDSITNIPSYTFYYCVKLALTRLPDNITSIDGYAFGYCESMPLEHLSNSLTSIGNNCFQNCTNLALTELPTGLTSIGQVAFSKCTNLAISKIPDGVTLLKYNTFDSCLNIKKISMNNVNTINGTSTGNGAFLSCTGLKQAWIGSAITSSGFAKNAFYKCTNLEKMYINLPRATVEAFSNYQYAFMNDTTKTGIIICNDDEGFITKEEFDALVIE